MKVRTTIRIDSETLKKAHQLGLNVSKCCENTLKVYIEALKKAILKFKIKAFLVKFLF